MNRPTDRRCAEQDTPTSSKRYIHNWTMVQVKNNIIDISQISFIKLKELNTDQGYVLSEKE